MERNMISARMKCYCILLIVLYMCRIITVAFETRLTNFIFTVNNFCTMVIFLLILVIAIKQMKRMPVDYFVLLFFVVLIYMITIKLHPEYIACISDEFWNNIISLGGGLAGYFFVRFVRDDRLIEKGLKISAAILFFVFFLQSTEAISKGYWYIVHEEEIRKSSYNMTFGYNMLIPTLIYLYYGMKEKKIMYILISMIGALEILMLGSRAAVLGIPAMIILYFLFCEEKLERRKRWALFICMLIALFVVVLFYKQILTVLESVFIILGFPSRTIERMMEGSLAKDVIRENMYITAKELIRNKFCGYGILSDRYYFGVYCHNIFYEILIQFGWIFGTILIVIFVLLTIKMLLAKKNSYKGIFLIFFCLSFFRLLVSHSFWINRYFWCAIGVAMTYRKSLKLKNIAVKRR